jgi:hypothetical protein
LEEKWCTGDEHVLILTVLREQLLESFAIAKIYNILVYLRIVSVVTEFHQMHDLFELEFCLDGVIVCGLWLLFHSSFKYECFDIWILKRYRYFTWWPDK